MSLSEALLMLISSPYEKPSRFFCFFYEKSSRNIRLKLQKKTFYYNICQHSQDSLRHSCYLVKIYKIYSIAGVFSLI